MPSTRLGCEYERFRHTGWPTKESWDVSGVYLSIYVLFIYLFFLFFFFVRVSLDVIDAFNTTSRYLDDILNINNVYFENMVSQIYPLELQLNKANASDTEAAFLDLHLSISNSIVSTKIYDKHDDFDFEIVNFPFLDGDVPRSTSYGVYISQLIRFARASSYVTDFNTRNKLLTQKLLKQGYRYHKLRKTFSKFYRRYFDLISKFQVGLKSLLRQGLSEPDFYGDLVYKLKRRGLLALIFFQRSSLK